MGGELVLDVWQALDSTSSINLFLKSFFFKGCKMGGWRLGTQLSGRMLTQKGQDPGFHAQLLGWNVCVWGQRLHTFPQGNKYNSMFFIVVFYSIILQQFNQTLIQGYSRPSTFLPRFIITCAVNTMVAVAGWFCTYALRTVPRRDTWSKGMLICMWLTEHCLLALNMHAPPPACSLRLE